MLYRYSFSSNHIKTTAANPPKIPAPTPARFWAPVFPVAPAVALDSALAVMDAVPAAEGADVAEVAEVPVGLAVEAQLTAEGRLVTPEVLQKSWANFVAAA